MVAMVFLNYIHSYSFPSRGWEKKWMVGLAVSVTDKYSEYEMRKKILFY